MVPFIVCGEVLWMLVLFSILWSVQKERNDKIFRGVSLSVDDILHVVTLRMAKWASLRNEFDSLKVEGILHNWEASLLCGLSKDRRVLHCTPPPVVTVNLNVGGVTRGKLGLAGYLVCLALAIGEFLCIFLKHVIVMDSNELEVMEILGSPFFLMLIFIPSLSLRVIQ